MHHAIAHSMPSLHVPTFKRDSLSEVSDDLDTWSSCSPDYSPEEISPRSMGSSETESVESAPHIHIQHDLPLLSKAYEEQYLREPIGQERCCVARDLCEGRFINGSPGFTLREFLLPEDQKRFDRMGTYPRNHGHCLLCTRRELQRNLLALKALKVDSSSSRPLFTIQTYGNLIDQSNEYKHGICHPVQPEFGIVAPIVRHKRKLLRFYRDSSSISWYKQIRVEFEDPEARRQHQQVAPVPQMQQQQQALQQRFARGGFYGQPQSTLQAGAPHFTPQVHHQSQHHHQHLQQQAQQHQYYPQYSHVQHHHVGHESWSMMHLPHHQQYQQQAYAFS